MLKSGALNAKRQRWHTLPDACLLQFQENVHRELLSQASQVLRNRQDLPDDELCFEASL